MTDKPVIRLLTYAGTLACLDASSGQLVHRLPDNIAPPLYPLHVSEKHGDGFSVAVAHPAPPDLMSRLTLKENQHNKLFTLRDGEKLLCFNLDGRVHYAGHAGDWEHLLTISEPDLALLYGATKHHWAVGQDAPVPAGLARFNFVLGTKKFDLRTALPLKPESTPSRLVFNGGPPPATRAAPRAGPPIVWIHPLGNIGNRALQYLAAHGIARRVPGAVVRNIHLDMWGMEAHAPRPQPWETAGTAWRYRYDTEGLADCLRRGEAKSIIADTHPYHLDHYPPRAECRRLLPPLDVETTEFGPNELVCSVRANEILRGEHKDYFPLPPAYYRMLQEDSGLDLVFFGQLGDDSYSRALHAAFPEARFVPGKNPAHDFESLRRARNIALSISTFAWAAAWLGEPARVYLPIGGMFSPVQHPDQLYIPVRAPEFRYVLLPPADSENLFISPARFWLMQDYLARSARFIGADEAASICARADALGLGPVRAKGFDGKFYLSHQPHAALAVRGLETTALGHYLATPGQEAPRKYRPFDPLFYGDLHPDAAAEVAAGHYPTLFAHFIGKGEALGYRPVP